jgi:dienelactone hydrolase
MSDEQKVGGYEAFLAYCRAFRAPMLAHRMKEIVAVMECLKLGRARPLRGNGDPFDAALVGGMEAAAQQAAAEAHVAHLLSRIDRKRVAMAGHSFGGATAVMAVQLPALRGLFHRCILYDPWTECVEEACLDRGLGKVPTLNVLSEAFAHNSFAPLTRRLMRREATDRGDSCMLPGTKHAWVSDVPFWIPSLIARATQQLGSMDARAAVDATAAATHAMISEGRVEPEAFGMVRMFAA